MRKEQQFSNLIYEYFLLRIHFKYYRCGSILPSIDTLYREFGVSPQTVKTALERLRAEGYIDMHNGRPTKVIYEESEQERVEFTRRYYSRRCDAFPDLYSSAEQVIIPLLTEGIRRMDDRDLDYIFRLSKRAGSSELMLFYCFTLQKLENPLVMNFFWESALFQAFPFAQEADDANIHNSSLVRDSLREIIACKRAGDWAGADRIFRSFQRKAFNEAYGYIRGQHCVYHVPKEEQIAFTWRIYRGHPQICYSLALHLLHQIYMGEYRGTEFLPSYEKMAQVFGASVSTMRRTVRLLCQLGVVQTINGRGTRICAVEEQGVEPDLTSPGVRLNLALFYQAFELIIYSCEAVIRDTFMTLTPDELAELLAKLEEYLVSGRFEFSLWCMLITIAMRSPLKGIREIYGKLYGLFLWGYPLRASISDQTDQRMLSLGFTQDLINSLKEGAILRCAGLVRNQVEQQFLRAEQYLHGHGISARELRNSPNIRLLLPSEPD